MSYGQSVLASGQALTSSGWQSGPILLENSLGVSVVAEITNFSGVTSGVLKLQVSNDYGGKEAADAAITNWADLPNGNVSVTANGNVCINADGIHYRWARLAWTASAGTATLGAQQNSTEF